MNPALGLALAAVFAVSVVLALRAGSARRGAAVLLLGAAAGLGLLRQIPLAAALGTLGFGLWRSSPARAAAPAAGQSSEVRTDGLAMTLDHDTGAMDGEVLAGPLSGRWLSDLDPGELRSLLEQFGEDEESLSLLRAYLERSGAAPGEPPPAGDAPMSRDEAYRVLGLEPGASAEEVRAAYRRLMRRVHPDLGGSGALAALLNTARQVLDPDGAEGSA